MHIVHSDATFTIDPNTGAPDYNHGNSLIALVGELTELRQSLFADQRAYVGESLQFLLPFDRLELYGPAGDEWQVTDPAAQDNKNDFQKQNVRTFDLADSILVRGWVRAGSELVPFMRIAYRAGPDSKLAQSLGSLPGDSIKLWARVGQAETNGVLPVPYDPRSATYAIEIWGAAPDASADATDAMARGALIVDTSLMWGTAGQFAREDKNDVDMRGFLPSHPMHPINPLAVELAWADDDETTWDSNGGTNHRYAFSMAVRGWENYLQAGISANPHGGVGFLEFRNLFSNYFSFARGASGLAPDQPTELGRKVEGFQYDAHGNKAPTPRIEDFFAVDYMDLHSVNVDAGIGLHRHRDNSEVFLLMEGQALMVIGDWLQHDGRARAFEARTLSAGQLAMLKGGQFHGLYNLVDSPSRLFMFGGYD